MNTKYIVMLVLVSSSTYSGVAFADNQDYSTSYSSMAVTYVQGFHASICGNHVCAPGEMLQYPKAVEPVRGN
jgi:hypothetical protein